MFGYCCTICQACRHFSLDFAPCLLRRGVPRLHRRDSLFAAVCRDAFSRLGQLACGGSAHPLLAFPCLPRRKNASLQGWGFFFLVCLQVVETWRAASPQLGGVSKKEDYSSTFWVRLAQERMLMVTARLFTSSSQLPVATGMVGEPNSRAPVTVRSYQLLRTMP